MENVTQSEIEDKIVKMFRQSNEEGPNHLLPSTLNLDDEIQKEYGLDSLEFVEWVMYVEKTLNISIPDNEAEKMKTLRDFSNYIINTINNG